MINITLSLQHSGMARIGSEGVLMWAVLVFHFPTFLVHLLCHSLLKINTCSRDRMESVLGKRLISTQFCPVAKGILNLWAMAPQIFKQSRSHLHILGTRRVTRSKFHTEVAQL